MSQLSASLLKRLRAYSLESQRTGGSPFLAAPRKKLPGGGTEVTGHRDYSPGDDYLEIDWVLCARRDELFVKLFEGRTDRDVHLLLDCSPSMGLGQPPKFQLARRIAAALGYVSLANLDRLCVAAFADGLVAELPPLRHSSRFTRLLQFLDEIEPKGSRTNLEKAVERFVRLGRRNGPVVVISDLFDPDGFERGFNLLRFHGYDPRLVHLFDPRESEPPRAGDVELVDVESRAVLSGTITGRTVRRYQALLAEFRESVREYCRRRGIFYLPVACDAAEDDVLRRVLGCRLDQPSLASSVTSTP